MSNYSKEYGKIFDYLSAPSLPGTPESTIVFGRKDPLVAHAVGDLALAHLAETTVITGGIGKDSGDIINQGFKSEAAYLYAELKKQSTERRFVLPKIILEEAATNGGENARNSLTLLNEGKFNSSTLTAVAHATSARRLGEMLKHEGKNINGKQPAVFIKPTDYVFNPENELDQDEARAELLRLADWPAKDWLPVQTDTPPELVEFARDQQNK